MTLEDAGDADPAGRRKRPVGEEEPERAGRGVRQHAVDVAGHPLGVGGGLRRPARARALKPRHHVVERTEHGRLVGRQELHLAVDALKLDLPADGERAHRQQVAALARLVPHGRRRLVEHRDDVDGTVPEGAEPVLQGQGLVVDSQPQPAGRDVFLDPIAILVEKRRAPWRRASWSGVA